MTLEEFKQHKLAGTLSYVWENTGSQRRVRVNGSLFSISNHTRISMLNPDRDVFNCIERQLKNSPFA